jgi:hypothetical protein
LKLGKGIEGIWAEPHFWDSAIDFQMPAEMDGEVIKTSAVIDCARMHRDLSRCFMNEVESGWTRG